MGDGDNIPEVYIGTIFEQTMVCLDGKTGSTEWTRQLTGQVLTSPALADIDGDGRLEVVFGGSDRAVRALNAEDGKPSWAYLVPKQVYSSPAVADLDGDEKAEIVFGCCDGKVYALDYNF